MRERTLVSEIAGAVCMVILVLFCLFVWGWGSL